MNKGKFIGLLLLTILLLSACKSYEIVEVPKDTVTEEQTATETLDTEQSTEEITQEEEPLVEETTDFELFNPDLTYGNSYNGPLYAAEMILNSSNVSEEELFTELDANGVNYVSLSIGTEDNAMVKTAITNNPSRIIPISNPGFSKEEMRASFTADTLPSSYEKAYNSAKSSLGTVKGLGHLDITQLGIAATNSKIEDIYKFSNSHNLILILQIGTGDSQRRALEEVLQDYPEMTILIHLNPDELQLNELEYTQLIEKYDNLYYEIDANDILYSGNGGLINEFKEEKPENAITDFTKEFDNSYQAYVSNAHSRYENLIEVAPNKIVWGTSLGPEYTYKSEIYNRIIKATRLFILTLPEENREDFAYKNALEIFGEGST